MQQPTKIPMTRNRMTVPHPSGRFRERIVGLWDAWQNGSPDASGCGYQVNWGLAWGMAESTV